MKNILRILALTIGLIPVLSTHAQEMNSLMFRAGVKSPEVHGDSVTFRLVAPKAVKVGVSASWLGYDPAQLPMKEGRNGVWSVTIAQPEPELYTYNFVVDGMTMLDPSNVMVQRDGSRYMNALLLKGGYADVYGECPKAGNLEHVWYYSAENDMNRRMYVYTPAGYEDNNQKYPVFYLLHGSGGDEEAWFVQGRVTQVLDNLIAAGKAEPMILVMTNGNAYEQAAAGAAPGGFVQPEMVMGGVKPGMKEAAFELSFPEVRKYIEKHFRTINDKKHRAIAGLSMGSFHTEHISKYYAGEYGYIGLFSGSSAGDGRRGAAEAGTCPVYTNFDQQMANLFSKKNKPYLYYVAIGKTDFLKEGNDAFLKYMDEKGYPYEYRETEGGHIWRNWRTYFLEFSQKVFK